MEAEILRRFIKAGAKPEEAIYRFLGKEDIYKKFLKKYLEQTGIEEIKQGIKKTDIYEVFKAAHTLKGVAANLGLESVQSKASEITEYTREKSFEDLDLEVLGALVGELEAFSDEVCEVIEIYCQ